MYISKFLLNRQKILNPAEIYQALATYFTDNKTAFFYRLEWYKIGISVPFTLYSEIEPAMRLMPECQLLSSEKMTDLPECRYFEFSIFAVPPLNPDWDPGKDEKAINQWFANELEGAATVVNARFGPNNRICYEIEGEQKQVQTVTITGTLQVIDHKLLDQLRRQPLGKHHKLGCGLLELTARSEYADKIGCRL